MGLGASGNDSFCASPTASFLRSLTGMRKCSECTGLENLGTCCTTSEDRWSSLCLEDMTLSTCTEIGGLFSGSNTCGNWTCQDQLGFGDRIPCCVGVLFRFPTRWETGGFWTSPEECEFLNNNPAPFDRFRITWSIGSCANVNNCTAEDENDYGACCEPFGCGDSRESDCSAAFVFNHDCQAHFLSSLCNPPCEQIGNPQDGGCYKVGTTSCEQMTRLECLAQWVLASDPPTEDDRVIQYTFDNEGEACSTTIYPGACCIGCQNCVDGMPEYLCELITGAVWKGVSTVCSSEDCSGV